MTVKLSTTISNIERDVLSLENKQLILQFLEFMNKAGTSEKYQNNNLKTIVAYSKFLNPSVSLVDVKNKEEIVSFLDTKIKAVEDDPDKRWITTWNDYLGRIKYFFRWLYNCRGKDFDSNPYSEWVTPEFVRIKKKKTKRISPYLESELWEKDELLTILKYEPHKRNKAILLAANNHYAGFGAATANMFRVMSGLNPVEWGMRKELDYYVATELKFPEKSGYRKTKQKTIFDYISS